MAKILLIVSGGIAAYKTCEFIRLARKEGHGVVPVLTKGGAEFVTALSLSALAEHQTYTDLFSLKDETEMGHIRLARECDIIVVVPCSANMIAKIAHGNADDLASTILLAADKPILIAPAMNPVMWENDAVQANVKTVSARGVHMIGPDAGDMACGETGFGRLADPESILLEAEKILGFTQTLKGLKAVVTSGPTFEPLDPVRYIGNRSSGKQGHAIAEELRKAGASVTLVSGPVSLPNPDGIEVIAVETAENMLEKVKNSLPADIFVGAAAVSDWKTDILDQKRKKSGDIDENWALTLQKTPDILAFMGKLPAKDRPKAVIGFALESENVEANAKTKLAAKNADAILVNSTASNPFGANDNRLAWLDKAGLEDWGAASKQDHAKHVVAKISQLIKG